MSGSDVLLDTNAIINIDKGYDTLISFLDGYKFKLYTSYICQIEVMSYPDLTDEGRENLSNFFTKKVKVLGHDDYVQENTIELKRLYPKIKLPDIIIAATSILYQFPIVTSDPHFTKIKYLGYQVYFYDAPSWG